MILDALGFVVWEAVPFWTVCINAAASRWLVVVVVDTVQHWLVVVVVDTKNSNVNRILHAD